MHKVLGVLGERIQAAGLVAYYDYFKKNKNLLHEIVVKTIVNLGVYKFIINAN